MYCSLSISTHLTISLNEIQAVFVAVLPGPHTSDVFLTLSMSVKHILTKKIVLNLHQKAITNANFKRPESLT